MRSVTPPRPRATPEIRLEAARKTVSGCSNVDVDAAEAMAQCIAAMGAGLYDGFEIGKHLDHEGFYVTAMLVEELDCHYHNVDALVREAARKWVEEYNIQPPHPVGTMTTKGEITGICEHSPACYLIRENGFNNPSRRLVVRFEDAVPIASVADAAGI